MKQLVCVSGPHGGGKTTLIGRLLASPTLKEQANETDVLRTSVVAKNNGTQPATAAATTPPAAELKLGFLGNVTHALALVGVSKASSLRNWAARS